MAALAVGAISASSASALQWWVGTPGAPRELQHGERLPINPEGSVKSDFSLKWDKKHFEVKCAGVSYDGLYLEGPIFLGATGIAFKECVAKKPKNGVVVGGEIVTTPLSGEITGEAPNVGFHLNPTGATLASFEIKASTKPHHKGAKFHPKECTYHVTATGSLSGSLGKAEKITTEKSFEFEGTSVLLKQSRSCITPPAPMHARRHGAKHFGAKDLTLATPAGTLPPGAPITVFSTNTIVSGGGVSAECSEDELGGELVTNGTPSDLIKITSTRNVGGEPGGACHSTIGPDTITSSNLPWTAELGSSGQAALLGSITYNSNFGGGFECTYAASKLVATLSFKGPLKESVVGQKYHLTSGGCAPEVEENGLFSFTSNGEPVAGEVSAETKEQKEEVQLQEEAAKEAEEEAEEAIEKAVEGTKGNTGYSAFEGWGVL